MLNVAAKLMPATNANCVLIVADNLDGELMRLVLEHYGMKCIHAQNEEEAHRMLKSSAVDAILVSWNDNEIDGCLVERLAPKFPHLKNVPVLLVTDYKIDVLTEQQLSRGGISWILQKPIVASSLPKAVRSAITESRAGRGYSLSIRNVDLGVSVSEMLPAVVCA